MENDDQFSNSVGHILNNISHKIEKEINTTIANNDKESYTVIKEYTVSNMQIINFLFLNQERDIFQKDIEDELKIKASTVSSILRRMEQKDMIRRERIDRDARLKRLVLSTKTRQLEERMFCAAETIENRFTKILSKEEYNNFVFLLKKIRSDFDSE